jgi:hypothetical protein
MSEITIQQSAYSAMPLEAVEAMLPFAKDNPNLKELLDAIITSKKLEAEVEVKAIAFTKAIEGIANKLPVPPTSIMNIHGNYMEVDIPDTSKPKEEVVITKDGKEVKEMRHPITRGKRWVITLNHVCNVRANGNSATTSQDTAKRALTVKQVVNDTVQLVGNFRNAKEACNHLKIEVNGDSAPRKLTANGYITTSYIGNDYLIKQS